MSLLQLHDSADDYIFGNNMCGFSYLAGIQEIGEPKSFKAASSAVKW